MAYLGDFRLGDTFDTKFTTVTTTGVPTVLAGSPVISAYVGNSTTELTAGITLSVSLDSVVGMNNVRVVATSGNGYATASNYQLVITTGTVGGASVVGYVVAEFSIENRSALMPTTAARTLDVSATGEGGIDWSNVGAPTTALALTGTTIAVTQKVDVDTIKTNPVVNGGTITFPSNKTLADTTSAVGSVTGAVGSVTGAVGSVTGNVGGNVTGSVGSVVGAVGSVTGAVGSVTGAVGSVTARVTANTDQLAGQSVTAAAGVTFPTSIASPTNITAGVITTTTNLTNLPSIPANWITAAGITDGAFTAAKFAAGAFDAVWSVAARTLTSFGTLAADVWAVATRQLTGTQTFNVTGNITGNVSGSVGSVTGAVGSVTGNVGGNVTGSVASVVANVNADIKKINGTTVNGDGSGTPWGP